MVSQILHKKSRVALALDNCSQWLAIDKLLTKTQAIIVPVPHFFTHKQIIHMVESVGVDTVICASEDQKFWKFQGFEFSTIIMPEIVIMEKCRIIYPNLPEKTHKITFTSGTTNEPKGVCLSLNHLNKVGESLAYISSKFGVKKHLSLLPLSVLLENVAANYAATHASIEVITPSLNEIGLCGSSALDIESLIQTLIKYQPDSIILMPQMLKAVLFMIEHHGVKLPFLKFVAVGGSVCSLGLLKKAQQFNLPVFEGYGISECGSVISLNVDLSNKVNNYESIQGSVGKILPHQKVKIADDGEIMCSGEIFLGYLGEEPITNDYFATGDLGKFDKDGNLHIIGRKKNIMINSFGRNISPDWIEAEILSLDEIIQVVIYGDSKPFITAICVSELNTDKLMLVLEELNKTLPDYAQIKKVIKAKEAFSPLNSMLTASGKTKHEIIFKHYQQQLEDIYV